MDLSVVIPSRDELFLAQTVADVLANMRGDAEIVVVLDGAWPVEPLPEQARVQILYQPVARGQRGAVNDGVRIASGRYVMKLDAHCAVSEAFDRALVDAGDELGADVTQVPQQYNLHAFDRICKACGHRMYQGRSTDRCASCQQLAGFNREVVWTHHRPSVAWRFNADLRFKYFGEYSHRPEAQRDIHDTMSLLGACWVMRRDRYWELEGLDEGHGGWGQMGTEIACKSWLSGGRLVTNRRCWFSHMFRTQGGDFGFPFPLSETEMEYARTYSRNLWLHNAWPGQIRPLSWILEHFAPVPGWHDPDWDESNPRIPAEERCATTERRLARLPDVMDAGRTFAPRRRSLPASAGLVYYSDCRPRQSMLDACMRQIETAANGHRIVAVTLAPVAFGHQSIVLPLERGPLTMFRQILAGLEALDTDDAFLAEHDVLYHPSHFEFRPPRRDTYYYNMNVWKVDVDTGRAVHYLTKQTSGLCADRLLLIQHYRERIRRCEAHGFSRAMGFEPGSHNRPERVDDVPSAEWWSAAPNVDLRHGQNLTASRWSQGEFRDQRSCRGWTEADAVPGWGVTRGRMPAFMTAARHGHR